MDKKTLQKSSKKNELRENQIYFLGKKRELLFGDIESISNDTICLKILGRTSLEKKKALQRFLNKETAKLIGEYLNKYDHFAYKSIKFSYYLSRWGSCSPQNDLTFNIKLAMCPPQVIEYVVVHELCHIEVKNHSKHFWSKVSEIFPDYSLCRKWLRDHRWYI